MFHRRGSSIAISALLRLCHLNQLENFALSSLEEQTRFTFPTGNTRNQSVKVTNTIYDKPRAAKADEVG